MAESSTMPKDDADQVRRFTMWLRISLFALVVVIIALFAPRLISGTRAGVPGVGSAAPDFTLPLQEGALVSLKEYHGSWVVLYFYPKDQTPGCTREAHNFQLDQAKYVERHAVVLEVLGGVTVRF